MARPVKLCTVTRLSRTEFVNQSWLGCSMRHFPQGKLPQIRLFVENTGSALLGLPQGYNIALSECDDNDILLLVHDDVYIHEWLLVDRLQEALTRFDVVGVAGSQQPDLRQPSWFLMFDDHLNPRGPQVDMRPSGVVAHGNHTNPEVSFYGESPAECQLLDGLLLALDVGKVRAAGLRFDERFQFHCYDIDFTRRARAAGLRVGTWPIAVTHASAGNFDSPQFRLAARAYLNKWQKPDAEAALSTPHGP